MSELKMYRVLLSRQVILHGQVEVEAVDPRDAGLKAEGMAAFDVVKFYEAEVVDLSVDFVEEL